jgi:hypothetical protein
LQSDLFVFHQGRFLPMADAGTGTAMDWGCGGQALDQRVQRLIGILSAY